MKISTTQKPPLERYPSEDWDNRDKIVSLLNDVARCDKNLSASYRKPFNWLVDRMIVQIGSPGCTLFDLIEGLKDAVYSLVDEFAFTLTVPIKGKMRFGFSEQPVPLPA